MSDAGAAPGGDPELRRARALLKLQQEAQQQGNTDLVKVVALGRKVNSLPAQTVAQARAQSGVGPGPGKSQAAGSGAAGAAGILGASSDRIQIPASNGRITLNPTAALVFGTQQEILEYSAAGTLSFQELILGPVQRGKWSSTSR